MASIIKSIASYLPDKILTNDDLSKMVDTNDKWIVERTGISNRRIASKEENTSDMAQKASQKALDKISFDKNDIDCLILATCTPDKANPATACIVAEKLGLVNIPAFDINAMCTGYIYGLQLCQGLIDSKIYKNILFVASEKLSDIVDWNDRSTCIIFGDGASASIIGEGSSDDGHEIIKTYISSRGDLNHLLGVEGKPSNSDINYLYMHGSEIYKHAVQGMLKVSDEVLKLASLEKGNIDWMVPHQANIRIIKAIADRYDVSMEKVVVTLNKYGNTSAASIPISLCEEDNNFQKGNFLLCPAFGGGLTSGASIIRW